MKLLTLTFTNDDGRIYTIDVDENETMDNVQAILEAEFGIPMDGQVLLHNGTRLSRTNQSLAALGIRANDMIYVSKSDARTAAGVGVAAQPRNSRRRQLHEAPTVQIDPALYTSLAWEDIPGNIDMNTLHAILRVNEALLNSLVKRDPKMYEAAKDPDPSKLRLLLLNRHMDHALPEAERAARMAQLQARLVANPFDVEAQRLVEEEIQRKNIEDNLEMAYEHMPEAFARVTMLYVDGLVNDHHVKIFVDSGAQTTIMSKQCAERCGIMRLVDTKFSGQAIGVGTARIIGRVHMAPLRIGEHHFPCTFTVLEQNDMEMLLGLDMLKRYQSIIDLGESKLKLRLGGEYVSVPFLGEAEMPKGVLGGDAKEMQVEDADSSVPVPAMESAQPAPSSRTGGHSSTTHERSTPPGSGSSNPTSSLFSPIDLSSFGGPTHGTQEPAARTPVQPTVQVNEGSVTSLMNMGFPRDKCIQALSMANGNLEVAISLISFL